MRVTAATKARTEEAILAAAEALFVEEGFARASTRGIARRAGVATGTIFNYFPSKEAIAAALVTAALAEAEAELDAVSTAARQGAPPTLAEDLFACAARALRALERRLGVLEGVLPILLDPSAAAPHLDRVAALLRERGHDADEPTTLPLYLSLFAGVMSFRLRDESPGAEDTLALLDRTTRAFEDALGDAP